MDILFQHQNFEKLVFGKKNLAVIGAGPKALAIAVKLKVLASLQFEVPNLVIFEKESVGHHWKADSAYTSGELHLGTSPHKDVTFPYYSQFENKELNKKVNAELQQYSWQAFLIEIQHYADWIDRGQPAPTHKLWAQYFEWVSEKVKDKTIFIFGKVVCINIKDKKWAISYQNNRSNCTRKLQFDGLVVTGPGTSKMPNGYNNAMKNCYDINGFWKWFNNKAYEKQFKVSSFNRRLRFAILGAGENSATICKTLLDLKSKYHNMDIDIYAPAGVIFSRGESFWENNIYTNPDKYHWNSLSAETRRAIINRTDRGVFSGDIIKNIGLCSTTNLTLIPAKVEKIISLPSGKICIHHPMKNAIKNSEYDIVISSIGTSIAQFLNGLLCPKAEEYIKNSIKVSEISDENLEARMDTSLAVSGLQPTLHIPVLSMLNQGSGFGNLSCLGTLADRIVKNYIQLVNFQDLRSGKKPQNLKNSVIELHNVQNEKIKGVNLL